MNNTKGRGEVSDHRFKVALMRCPASASGIAGGCSSLGSQNRAFFAQAPKIAFSAISG